MISLNVTTSLCLMLLKQKLQNNKIYILDIETPTASGIDIARKINIIESQRNPDIEDDELNWDVVVDPT